MISLKILFAQIALISSPWISSTTPKTLYDPIVSKTYLLSRLRIDIQPFLKWILGSTGNQFHPNPTFVCAGAMILLLIALELVLTKNAKLLNRENALRLAHHRELATQNIKLQKALKLIDENAARNRQVFHVIAHDLRSPIAGIVGLAAFLLESQQLASGEREVMELIHTTGLDSLHLMDKMLDEKEFPLDREMVDLHFLLNYCIAQLQPRATQKNQKLILDNSTSVYLNLNRNSIWRVIHNLVTNAIKFSPIGSKIAISVREADHKVTIAVKDQGIGIPEELASEIFGGGQHLQRVGTAGEKSYGLGLSLSKQIVEEHNGALSFKQNADGGTTFLLELPDF